MAKELPYLVDKQILRVNGQNLKDLLEPYPSEILHKVYLSLPPEIKHRSSEIDKYLEASIKELKISTTNVSDFVKQMKSLKAIDKRLSKIKDKISFIGQMVTILENVKGHIVQGVDKDSSKNWKSYQTALLQNMSSLENAMSKA